MASQGWRFAGMLLVLLSMSTLQCEAAEVDAALTRRIDAALKEEGLAGAVWATVDAAGNIHTGAAGLKNAATGEPMSADTRVHVGSIPKSLIATGVLHLVSTGRLDLDVPVQALLPQLRFDNPWQGSPVRVRHLLDHTAGLDDVRFWQLFSADANPDTPLGETFTRDPSLLAIRSRPGARFSYSNMGYTLAAMVIEHVVDERYEAFLGRELLRPLGMRDSTFAFTTQVGPQADPRLAWGHLDDLSLSPALPVYVRPAAQFTTTAHDLALFAKFVLGDGSIGGRELVRPGLLRAMGRSSGTEAARAGLQTGYGLGLGRRDRHGVVGLCHSGNVVGFHAMLCLFPQKDDPEKSDPEKSGPDRIDAQAGKAFVIVHNADREGADYDRFDALMVQALVLPRARPTPVAASSADVGQWHGRYVPAPNRMATFAYVDFLFGSARLTSNGSSLRWSPLQGKTRVLAPTGGLTFVANDRSTTSHVLLRGQHGEHLISDGFRTHRKVGAAFYWSHMASLISGAFGLLWLLLGVPIRGMWKRRWGYSPGFAGALLLLLPVPLFLMQSFVQLGDRTPASMALYAGTATLPVLMAWQVWIGLRRRDQGAARVDLVAALLVLQWCVVLGGWGMLPFALWR